MVLLHPPCDVVAEAAISTHRRPIWPPFSSGTGLTAGGTDKATIVPLWNRTLTFEGRQLVDAQRGFDSPFVGLDLPPETLSVVCSFVPYRLRGTP